MLTDKVSPAQVFFKAIKVALKYKNSEFGDLDKYERTWDCSWFVATVLREITGVKNLYSASAAAQAVTGLFCGLCNDVPILLEPMQVPLLFLYDHESDQYPQETVHVGIAMPDIDYLSLLGREGNTGEILKDIITVDLQNVKAPFTPRVHPASDWFATTPLSEVRITGFGGLNPPVYPDGKRFAVAPAFLDLKRVLRTAALICAI